MAELTAEELKKIKDWPWNFDIQTEIGTLTCTYDPRMAMNYFERYFMERLANTKKHTYDITQWMICIDHAQTLLYRGIQAIINDSLKQVVREVRVRTLCELNDSPVFLRQKLPPDYPDPPKPFPVVAFRLHPDDKPADLIERVAEVALQESKRRMNAPRRGGSKSKLSGLDRALIDERYDEYHSASKKIKKLQKKFISQTSMKRNDELAEAWIEEVMLKNPEWEGAFRMLFDRGYDLKSTTPSDLARARLAHEHDLEIEYVMKLISEVKREKKRMMISSE